MTTHEQKDRNAEIVQRRLDGEHTTELAREYGVTPTRIAQLVRRYREKSGEVPNTSRRKKKADGVRPRLRKIECGQWECAGAGVARTGKTPQAAYDRWMANIVEVGLAAGLKGLSARLPVAAAPQQPYTGPVTVVAGTKVAPKPLVISPAMRFTMERAGLAQQPIRGMGVQRNAGRAAS